MNEYHGRARRLAATKPKGDKTRLLRRIVGLFQPFRWHMAALFVLTITVAALNLLPALLIERMVDVLTPPLGDTGQLTTLFAIALGMYVASGLLNVLAGYLNQLVGQGLMYNLRRDLHAHLQRMGVRFFTSTKTGEILSRVTTDVNQVQQSITNTFSEFLTNFVTIVIAMALMFAFDWRLALVAAIVLPLWVFPTIRIGNIMRRLQLEWQEEAGRMSGHLEETLSVTGSMVVKAFGRQDYEAARFDESNAKLRSLSIRRLMAGRWFNMGTELFGYVSVIVVWWMGGMIVLGGDLQVSQVVAFAYLVQRVFMPFRMISRIHTTLLTSLAVFERIFEYLDLPVEVEERPDAVRLDRPRGHVAFRDVRFAYQRKARPALDGVTFEVEPGQMVALVGPSGAGKTTITYLLQRFYDPQEGDVRLDGYDLRELTLDSITAAVGTVMQDTYLFHTSLSDNIRYGRLDARDDEVEAAARAAGLGPLVERLPEGLATVVGERGFRLSGGEKQRVAIARAILKDPPVLILDEATSSLDSRLEREIREATARLAKGRTTVVIAHRLSTVVAADCILVLEHGRIVERGTHAELLQQGGLYASLYREQFSHEEDGGAPPLRAPARHDTLEAASGGA